MPPGNDKTKIDLKGIAPLLLVFDIEASIGFYCNILGFEMAANSSNGPRFGWVLLRLNNVEIMLEPLYPLKEQAPRPDPLRVQHHADTFLYLGCPDIDAAYDHLKSKGIPLEPPRMTYYGMKQVYFSDPDGYRICFQWPIQAT